ncbi:hypothetical protein H5410_054706 [Solanum commersonii]|uniref:Uncharacterized protein n=1 Tax=Solanum commersonii TaxID=4109 RepID=A0A9J5WH66_SOLCO|nr:hypothetical protein H5410_054706 [Solanum commersonii]
MQEHGIPQFFVKIWRKSCWECYSQMGPTIRDSNLVGIPMQASDTSDTRYAAQVALQGPSMVQNPAIFPTN